MPDPALLAQAEAAAQNFGIPVDLFIAQIQQESSFNPNPPGQDPSGPAGIAQFIPGTAAQYGVTNRYDPAQALWGAAAYDAALFKQKGSWLGVLQGYGTIPTNTPLTPSQQALANQAQALGNTPGAQVATTGPGQTAPQLTPATFPVPNLGQIGGAIGDFFIRAAVILVGIVLLWVGFGMLHNTVTVEGPRSQ